MKKRSAFSLANFADNARLMFAAVMVVLAIVAWFFVRRSYYCTVEYSGTSVSCNGDNCNKCCYMYSREKGSENPWNSDTTFVNDTTKEYRCRCQ